MEDTQTKENMRDRSYLRPSVWRVFISEIHILSASRSFFFPYQVFFSISSPLQEICVAQNESWETKCLASWKWRATGDLWQQMTYDIIPPCGTLVFNHSPNRNCPLHSVSKCHPCRPHIVKLHVVWSPAFWSCLKGPNHHHHRHHHSNSSGFCWTACTRLLSPHLPKIPGTQMCLGTGGRTVQRDA